MNESQRPSYRFVISGEWACFRRPEFEVDFVTYDVMPPLHLLRLLDRCITDANEWIVRRVSVLTPIACEWLAITTSKGTRRALALRSPKYIVDLEPAGREITAVAPTLKDSVSPHLGLAEYPASVQVVQSASSVPAALDIDCDLGWMPVALARQPERTTLYQRLRLNSGVLDLSAQDGDLRAR